MDLLQILILNDTFWYNDIDMGGWLILKWIQTDNTCSSIAYDLLNYPVHK